MERLRAFVYSSVLLLIFGWILHIGQEIFVPAVLGAVIVYVVVGLAHTFDRIPLLRGRLPLQLRYALSIMMIAAAFFGLTYLLMANKDRALLLAPGYQESLLTSIQRIAAYFGIETEPTWATLRQELVAQINIQRLFTSLLTSLSSILVTFVVVLLYATFLLVERRAFDAKLANVSDDPARVAHLRRVIRTINRRIGSYLALKTLLSLLLGAVSWVVMALFALEFAVLWAVLTAFLNFVPYIGSALGVALPVLMAVVQFHDPATIFWLLVWLTVAQFLIGNFLDPYVMGSSLNLSPFAILISLAIWSELWGIPGAFLAVPITAIMAIVFCEFPGTRPIAVLLSKSGQIEAGALIVAKPLSALLSLIRAAASNWVDDHAQSMGAALAFYTVFSIAPLLLIVIAVAGLFFGQEAARGEIHEQLQGLLGSPGALAVQSLLESASRPASSVPAAVFGLIVLFVGATSVFAELQDALDRIWRAPKRAKGAGLWGLLRARLLSFGLILGIGFLLVVSLAFSAAMQAMGRRWHSSLPDWGAFADAGETVLSIVFLTALFAMIYKMMPRARIAWRDVWVGAAVTSLLFIAGKFFIGLYIGRSGIASPFGAAASLIVVLLWVYYSAQIFLFGAEFTWAYSHRYGSRRTQPPAGARPDATL